MLKQVRHRFSHLARETGASVASLKSCDGLILAETALAGIPVLATSDADLLDIEETELRVQFEDADLSPVQICHPKLLLKAMAPKW